ncbi:hypothetical protein N183_11040 [Sinorhizobium sp. Sb3]|uniref:DUF2000 domain-containing protein n=1 Tax=Sinorhizobium/Ensifer group TaxID=227292 RepID=UPI00071C59C5|nr:DUF2000 domain-containing protein [Sinorhizobium sp. Sb3]KSV61134.1 hypothetical protein N183_11040 [Sinorhizobium sp. Sb3]
MLQDIRLAIIVNPELPPGHLANTIAAISIGIGAAMPVLGNRQLTDSKRNMIDISSNRPIPILQADSRTIGALLLKALPKEEDRIIVPFPAFARSLHDYADYEMQFPERDLFRETIDGVGLAGASKWVKSLTGSLKLLR